MARPKLTPVSNAHPPAAEPERSGNPDPELERSSGSVAGTVAPSTAPDPEFTPRRRHFTADYKRRILREVDACQEHGAIGRLLRKEGLYSSLLTTWRKEFEAGGLSALSEQRRGRPPQPDSSLQERVTQLEREKAHLEARLAKADALISVQKKLSQALGLVLTTEEHG